MHELSDPLASVGTTELTPKELARFQSSSHHVMLHRGISTQRLIHFKNALSGDIPDALFMRVAFDRILKFIKISSFRNGASVTHGLNHLFLIRERAA